MDAVYPRNLESFARCFPALDHYYADLAPLLGNIIIEHGTLEGCAGRMLARLNGRGDDFSANQYAAKKTFNEKIKLARTLVEQNVVDAKIKTEFYAVLEAQFYFNVDLELSH